MFAHRDREDASQQRKDAAEVRGSEPVPAGPAVPFGLLSRQGVLNLQRTAGNQATVAFLRRQGPGPDVPTRVASSPPTVQRNFLGDVIRGAGSYIADLGRGVKRTAKGLKFWDSDAMTKIAQENEAGFRLFKRLATGGYQGAKDMVEEMLVVGTGGFLVWSALPASIQKQASDKFDEAAKGIMQKIIAKQVGKLIVHKIVKQIAIKAVQTELYKQIAKKLGATAGLSSTGIGVPVAMLGIQGMIEKASGSADRLKSQFPVVYDRLEPKDLHMAWFLVEDHVPELLKELYQVAAETIQTTTRDGRILVGSGGGNDRVPINAGGGSSEGRVPIRTGPSERRVPINAGP
jgi:hypothetical protein